MKSIYPESLCLQFSSVADTPLRTPKRSSGEAQLVITMPLLDGEVVRLDKSPASHAGAGTCGTPGMTPQKHRLHTPVACHAEFVRRLLSTLEGHCIAHLKSQACLHAHTTLRPTLALSLLQL
jgi:hypothetical protein